MRHPLKIASLVTLICLGIIFLTKYIRSDSPHPKAPTLLTIKQQPLGTTLYGTGILRPSSRSTVTSPAEGTITAILFHYGDVIGSGQPLFRLSSPKLLADYRRVLTGCIKAKSEALASKSELQKSRLLHDAHLIADEEFQNRVTAWHHARLVLLEAQAELDSLLRQLNLQESGLRDVKLQDIHSLEKALRLHEDTLEITVISPVRGVILTPPRTDSHTDPALGIQPGDSVKQGEVLALLGNTEILQISIPVNEFSISQFSPGLPATLSGAAFRDMTLSGTVTRVPMEATPSSDGMPLFRIEVTTAPLTREQAARIHPGMSAEVAIHLQSTPLVTIPLSAIHLKSGGNEVLLRDPATGQVHPVPISTGETTEDSVVVSSGLREGDQIVIPDQTGKH